jgi:hypothetical protein
MQLNHYGNGVNLGDIIDAFAKLDPTAVLPIGLHEPHSYRGYYHELAFEACTDATVSDILDELNSAVGETFEGYKGGDYRMDRYSQVWIAPYGSSGGDCIGPMLLHFLVSQTPITAPVPSTPEA